MKIYTLKFNVTIVEGSDGVYDPPKIVNFSVTEKLPSNVDAEKYVKQRLAEEVKRNFMTLDNPIDNKTEDFKQKEDPLLDF